MTHCDDTPSPPFKVQWPAATALLSLALLSFSNNVADVDLWGNTGFVDTLPWLDGFHYTNTYSYSCPDATWINHEWGAEYLMNLSYQIAGGTGLLIQKLLLGFFTLALMILSARKQHCKSGAVVFICLALVVSTMGYGFSRPHHYTFACLAWFFYVLKHHPDSRLVWTLPVVGLLWANLHGAFFIGILLLLVCITISALPIYKKQPTPRMKPLKLTAVAAGFFICSLINPYGIHLWDFVFQTAGVPRPYLSEWAPLNLIEHGSEHTDFLALLLVGVICVVMAKEPRNPIWISLMIITLISAFAMRRNILLFAVTMGFLLPEFAEEAFGKQTDKLIAGLNKKALTGFLCILAVTSIYFSFSGYKNKPTQIEVDPEMFPAQMVQFLKEQKVEANIIVFWDWAEQAIWHLYPNSKVFIDGRLVSAYEPEVITDYLAFIYGGPGEDKALTEYDTNMVLIHRQNPAYLRMTQQNGWSLAVEDAISALFVKNDIHGDWLNTIRDGHIPFPKAESHPVFP